MFLAGRHSFGARRLINSSGSACPRSASSAYSCRKQCIRFKAAFAEVRVKMVSLGCASEQGWGAPVFCRYGAFFLPPWRRFGTRINRTDVFSDGTASPPPSPPRARETGSPCNDDSCVSANKFFSVRVVLAAARSDSPASREINCNKRFCELRQASFSCVVSLVSLQVFVVFAACFLYRCASFVVRFCIFCRCFANVVVSASLLFFLA